MGSLRAVFLDDGGVINDNLIRGAQWPRLVGEFFPPLLGGAPEAWAEANRVVVPALFADYQRTMTGRDDLGFNVWLRENRIAWTRGMCDFAGVAAPPDDVCIDLALRASAFVTRRVRAAYPGAVEAITTLHHRGFTLFTASGEDSTELDGYLSGLGVRGCFIGLYGPDVIDTPKEGPAYYERIFADTGVRPADALVVDDNLLPLSWAAAAGARTVLVSATGAPAETAVIRALAELPQIIDRL